MPDYRKLVIKITKCCRQSGMQYLEKMMTAESDRKDKRYVNDRFRRKN